MENSLAGSTQHVAEPWGGNAATETEGIGRRANPTSESCPRAHTAHVPHVTAKRPPIHAQRPETPARETLKYFAPRRWPRESPPAPRRADPLRNQLVLLTSVDEPFPHARAAAATAWRLQPPDARRPASPDPPWTGPAARSPARASGIPGRSRCRRSGGTAACALRRRGIPEAWLVSAAPFAASRHPAAATTTARWTRLRPRTLLLKRRASDEGSVF